MRVLVSISIWASALIMGSAHVHASDPPKAVRELLDEGNRLMEARDYEAALRKYRSAHAVYPASKIYFNIAEANRELGRVVEAVAYFERFLEAGGAKENLEVHEEAKRQLPLLLRRLGTVTITSRTAEAIVLVNGRPIGSVPVEKLRLNPGQHDVSLEKPKYAPKTFTFNLDAGQHRTFEVSLHPLLSPEALRIPPPIAPPPDVPHARGTTDEEPLTSKWWFWTAVIGGAALVAGATALAVTAGGRDSLERTSDWDPL